MPENIPAVASSDHTVSCFIRRLEKQWNKLTLGASSVLEITFLRGWLLLWKRNAILETGIVSMNKKLSLFSGTSFFFIYKFLYKLGQWVNLHASQLPGDWI